MFVAMDRKLLQGGCARNGDGALEVGVLADIQGVLVQQAPPRRTKPVRRRWGGGSMAA